MPADKNQDSFKRARKKLYAFYDYTLRRPSGVVWAQLLRAIRFVGFAMFVVYIVPYAQLFMIVRHNWPAITATLTKYFARVFQPIAKAFTTVYRYFFGEYTGNKIYRRSAVNNKLSDHDSNNTAQADKHKFNVPHLDDMLFARICCGELSQGLSALRSDDSTFAEYIEFLDSFKEHIKDSNPTVYQMLHDNAKDLKLIAQTSSGTIRTDAIAELLIKDGTITFGSGYDWENNDDPTMPRSVKVETIVKIRVTDDGEAYLYIYKNHHHDVSSEHTRDIAHEMLSKGPYIPNVQIIRLKSNDPAAPLTRESVANSEVVHILASGKSLGCKFDATTKITTYAATIVKIDAQKAKIRLEIATYASSIEALRSAMYQREAKLRGEARALEIGYTRDGLFGTEIVTTEPTEKQKLAYAASVQDCAARGLGY